MKRRSFFIKLARITLVLYLVAVTAFAVVAFMTGPFKEPLELAAKIRLLEGKVRENEITRRSVEEERARLLSAVRSLSQEKSVLITRINELRQKDEKEK